MLICLNGFFLSMIDLNGSKEPTARAPWNATYTDSLKRSLLVGYDKFARPSHHNLATNVSMGISIYHVELDDLTGVMTVHGWIKLVIVICGNLEFSFSFYINSDYNS